MNDRMKKRRIELGLTLVQVAEYLGVKDATVQRYESGEIKNIKHETILKLSEVLKCDPCYLLGWVNTPPSPIEKKPSEYQLLYEKLDDIDRNRAISYMEGLLENDKYNKKHKIYRAAKSMNNEKAKVLEVSKDSLDKLRNAPETDDIL